MKYLLLFAMLCACADKKDDVNPKTLRASWASAQGAPNWSVDLSGSLTKWTYGTGGSCQSNMALLQFSSAYGQITLSGTVDVITFPGMANCSQFDGTWDYYLLEGEKLLLCKAGSPCVLFK